MDRNAAVELRDALVGPTVQPVVHVFNGPYVTVGGVRIEIPEGSKRLLALVALRGGRVERRHAAGALWPCGDDHRAAGNLRSSLSRLRGAGIDVLEVDKWSLRLQPGVCVDINLVLDWATRVINGRGRTEDLEICADRVEALDLLPGWYDDWAIVERERVRQRVLHALEALSRALVQIGRHADAVDAAMAAINAEPLRESAQRVLITAHVAEGNWVEARRAYSAYRSLLWRELGVEPSHELGRLIDRNARAQAGDHRILATV